MIGALGAGVFSVVMLWMLAGRDPKRLRAARQRHLQAHSRKMRWLLLLVALMPGVLLIGLGSAASVLIWFGTLTVGGWLVAEARAPRNNAV